MDSDQKFPESGFKSTPDRFKQRSNQSVVHDCSSHNCDDLEEPEIDNILSLCSIQPKGQSADAQNKGGYFDVTKFVPTGMKVHFTERGGSLYIAHTINEFAIKVLKRKVDLVIFQCMLRFTLGFRRPICKLSYTFIANWTGLQIPNVRRGISNLLEIGLVHIAIPHSSKELKATIYEVPIVREYLDWLESKEKSIDQNSERIYPPKQSDYYPIIESLTKKEKGKEKLKTLSQKIEYPVKIRDYLLGLRPHHKRVDEEHYLHQLLIDYKPEEVADALDYVQLQGTIDSLQPVHSPMKYLSYTIESVLSIVKERREKLKRIEDLRREAEAKIIKEESDRAEEAELYRKALSQFESKLSPDEQDRVLNDYYKENFADYGGFISKNTVKRFAISNWYRGIANL